MIKYRTTSTSNEIEAFEVSEETDKFVVYQPRAAGLLRSGKIRELKRSAYQKWYDTWDEAHQYLLERARRRVERAQANLENVMEALDTLEAIDRPAQDPNSTESSEKALLNRMESADPEKIIKACLPGGSSCDPQQVADAIRDYFQANSTTK